MNSLVIVFLVAVSTAYASYGGVVLKAPTAGAIISGPTGHGLGAAGAISAYAVPGHNGYGAGGWNAGWNAGWNGGWNGGWAGAAAAPAWRAGPMAVGYAGHGKVGTLIDGPSGQIRTNGNPNGLVAATHGYTAPGPAPAVRAYAAPAIAIAAGPAYGGWNGNDGSWNEGRWNDGRWNDGKWNDGQWNDGRWNDGKWDDGRWDGDDGSYRGDGKKW